MRMIVDLERPAAVAVVAVVAAVPEPVPAAGVEAAPPIAAGGRLQLEFSSLYSVTEIFAGPEELGAPEAVTRLPLNWEG